MNVIGQTISEAFNSYYNQLPQGALNVAASSYLVSFGLVTLLSGGNFALGLVGAAVAATASLIDSAIRPIINQIFSDPTSYFSSVLRKLPVICIVAGLSSVVAPALIGIGATISIANSFALNCIFGYLFPERDPTQASEYVFLNVPLLAR